MVQGKGFRGCQAAKCIPADAILAVSGEFMKITAQGELESATNGDDCAANGSEAPQLGQRAGNARQLKPARCLALWRCVSGQGIIGPRP